MTFAEVEKRNQVIIENAIMWANNGNCSPLTQFDAAIVAEYLSMDLPKSFYYFEHSEFPNQCRATKNHKTILKTLDIMSKKLRRM